MPTRRGPRAIRRVRAVRLAGGRAGSLQAHGATFAQLTHHRGLPLVSPLERAGAVLGPHAAAKWGRYDTLAQGWAALALSHHEIASRVNGETVGTGAELVVCGYFLAHGATLGRDLFFQDDNFILDFAARKRVAKPFTVDIAIKSRWGGDVFINIDGHFFHTAREIEEFKDAARDGLLPQRGRAVTVKDTDCYRGETLVATLARQGVTA